MRLLNLALILILVWLQYSLFYKHNGLLDYWRVEIKVEEQLEINQRLEHRNAQMYAEIEDLRQGLDAIEERAREHLGLVKEKETFYRFIETK